jgi:anaerobic selenocysteine-containing dehydrogenase
MSNRKLSRRDALKAGALGTVGLAAGSGGLSLGALGQAAKTPPQQTHNKR